MAVSDENNGRFILFSSLHRMPPGAEPARPIQIDRTSESFAVGEVSDMVLVAEDDSNDVFLLRHAFEEAGVHCPMIAVEDGQEAINYLSGQPPYCDRGRYPMPRLLLLDLKMPAINGFELLAWLQTRPELKDLPAIVLSSSNQETDISRARELGARDYLVKPSVLNDLVRLVEQLQARWLNRLLKGNPRLVET